MHELSIAESLILTVIDTAKANKATNIAEISLELGAMRMVVPEALEMAFQVVSKDTMAEGATLRMTEVPVRVKCSGCSEEFEAEMISFICPACHKAEGQIISGNDILITSLVCDVEDE